LKMMQLRAKVLAKKVLSWRVSGLGRAGSLIMARVRARQGRNEPVDLVVGAVENADERQ
jgi:hypothetical protein